MSSSSLDDSNEKRKKTQRMGKSMPENARGTIRQIFHRQKSPQAPPPSSPSAASKNDKNVPSEDPDTERTQQRYERAKENMKAALQIRRNEWGAFEWSDLDTLSEQDD